MHGPGHDSVFYYLSGKKDIFATASRKIEERVDKTIEFLNDGCVMNFEKLKLAHLDHMFPLMVQAFVVLGIEPFNDFFRYTRTLYALMDVPHSQRWEMPMSDKKRMGVWLERICLKPHHSRGVVWF